MNQPIIIIGAGLTGLTLAYLLEKEGKASILLEARNRIGGRIQTDYQPGGAPVELGATWLGKKHQRLVHLLDELGLQLFEQRLGRQAIYEPISTSPPQLVHLPPNEEPSFRIAGGTSRLIAALADRLRDSRIRMEEVVKEIRAEEGEGLQVISTKGRYQAQTVISTLPPNLLVKTIRFQPGLPEELTTIASKTHTWMGESIKIGFRYKEPFWRQAGKSGTIFSSVGPISELYDHADVEDQTFALKGFMNGAFAAANKEERKSFLLSQLQRYYGEEAQSFVSYEEAVWCQQAFTYVPYDSDIIPHQYNGHAIFHQTFWNGRLLIAGSETSPNFPGYMEGAVQSAELLMRGFL